MVIFYNILRVNSKPLSTFILMLKKIKLEIKIYNHNKFIVIFILPDLYIKRTNLNQILVSHFLKCNCFFLWGGMEGVTLKENHH